MPDLELVKSIDLEPLTRLETLSMPKLLSAERIWLGISSYLDNLEFLSLRRADGVWLQGNLTKSVLSYRDLSGQILTVPHRRVSLGALEIVDDFISIKNIEIPRGVREAETAMDISLPVLEQAPSISIEGRASRYALIPEHLTRCTIVQPV
jgi:hypothetical protein